MLVIALFYSRAKLYEGKVDGILRGSQLMWHLRSVVSFEVTADVFQVRRESFKRGDVFHNPIHLCLTLSLPFIALQWIHWIRDVYIRSNEHLLVGFTNVIFLPPPSPVALSLVFVAGPDRPLSSRMMIRTLGSSTMLTGNALSAFSSSSPQRRLAVLWTGHDKVTFLAVCFSFPLLPTSTQRLLQSVLPDTKTIFWLMCIGIMNSGMTFKHNTLFPSILCTQPWTRRRSDFLIQCLHCSGERSCPLLIKPSLEKYKSMLWPC